MGIISNRLRNSVASPTVAISDKALNIRASGREVIGLAAGEPDFDTPKHIKNAAIEAMDMGKTKYTQVDGTPELKAAICRKFKRENNIISTPEMVSVSAGGKQVLFNAMMATIDPGDEVLIPTPYWVSFAGIVEICGGVPVSVNGTDQESFKIKPEDLEAAISKKQVVDPKQSVKPGGVGYSTAELTAFVEVLRRYPRIHVISDDIYEHLIYDDFVFATLAGVAPDIQDRILTVNGVSKSYCMTGWRIGYGIGPKKLIKAMAKVQSQSTSNPNSIAQHAAIAALDGPTDFIKENLRAFSRRRKLVCMALNEIDGIFCREPDGAFYVYPCISGLIRRKCPSGQMIETDTDFATYLLDFGAVAVVPGAAALSVH